MTQPFLLSDRLALRPLVSTDLDGPYLDWINDREVTRFLDAGRMPLRRTDLEGYLERFDGSRTDLLLAIIERETDRHIGNVTLNGIHWVHRRADTGLMIGARDCWGQGYAREAWSLLIQYAFQQLGLHKIVAGVVDGNDASARTLERLGFQLEGRLRGEFFLDGDYLDVLRFGLFFNEFVVSHEHKAGKWK